MAATDCSRRRSSGRISKTTASSVTAASIAGIVARIELVAATRSTVLITGETGTGKELVARAIHDRSAQREMPFIKVNCAAIPETLLESELFGHVRGAFTGAVGDQARASSSWPTGGSIFLDEIGTMSTALQAKLLRVLQEREIEPLGAERTERVDVRVIAATNRDLRQLVDDGRFQDDLFYRLHVIPIALPPLRERPEDIAPLIEYFVHKHAAADRPVDRRTRGRRDRVARRTTTGRATCASSRTRSNARWC